MLPSEALPKRKCLELQTPCRVHMLCKTLSGGAVTAAQKGGRRVRTNTPGQQRLLERGFHKPLWQRLRESSFAVDKGKGIIQNGQIIAEASDSMAFRLCSW